MFAEFFTVWFYFLTTIFVILWLYFEAPIRAIKKQLKCVPGPEPLPIFGNLLSIKSEKEGTLQYFKKCFEKYGAVFKVQFAGRVTIFLSNPEDVEMLLKSTELLQKSKANVECLKSWVGEGLFTSDGALWREHRKIITPAFHFNILEKFFDIFKKHSDVLIDILHSRENQNINVYPLMSLFALDVICETAMGTKIQAQTKLEGNDYVAAAKQTAKCVSTRLTSFLLSIPLLYPFTRTGRKEKEALQIIQSHTSKIIKTRREQLLLESNHNSESGEKKRTIFLDILLQSHRSDGKPLSNKEIIDEVQSFMFGGHDTISTQMAFMLYLLTKEPEVQQKLYEEQCEILDGGKRDPTFQDIQNMHYLRRTIKESQRLLGSVITYGRVLTQNLTLKTNGYILPKGTHVSVFLYQLHRNPNVYKNPDKFDPDRFLPENVRVRHPFAFVPFSAGPRNCIGQKFAMLEMKTCLSKIVRHFKILPAVDGDGKLFEPELRSVFILNSINGVYIRLCPRQ